MMKYWSPKSIFFGVIGVVVFLSGCESQVEHLLVSPNTNLKGQLAITESKLHFIVVHDTDTILSSSTIGLELGEIDLTQNVDISEVTYKTYDNTWSTVNGKQPTVKNSYNEYTCKVVSNTNNNVGYNIQFRMYNDGFAFRYHFPKILGDSLTIQQELTKLNIQQEYTYWSYNGERHNLGPISSAEGSREKVKTPMVIKTNTGKYISALEGAIKNTAPFSFNVSNKSGVLSINNKPISVSSGFETSWRTFIIGDKAGSLVSSDLLVNLNEPNKIEDSSWIKPGKALWDWRVWGYTTKDGFVYGGNTVSHKRMIDFASQNNIQYLLIDADWYGSEFNESSDPTTSKSDIDIEECIAYGKKNNVGIILYLNDVGAKTYGLENVIKQFAEWGAVGIKYGFMKGTPKQKVIHTQEVVQLCAKYKLMVNFHDSPVTPSGDYRTWPNLMSKEYGHAQADAKRSYYPETAVNATLINLISGPLDLTNGYFDLNEAHKRDKVFQQLPGTVVAEVAKLIAVHTGWMVLPDSPEAYMAKEDLFNAIRQMPAQFNGFKVLDGEIDEFVSIARKAGENWFVGSLTNREGREINLPLDFLDEGEKYKATFYEDTSDSHFLENKESYTISITELTKESNLKIRMAPGGGHVLHLEKIN
ncbi:glycoside hydrolase family 97 protein [Maribacter dokdonensis]|uniref:glycoside hydrolase family 97 protein n=1 Tax=Maribacter dokdonensis TaxID=320912 RepID=UPI000727F46B|nr:glycoside hydrolase family 97 protein [Maribacter dokdonensis]KSA12205.1 Alpha-glucosidase [Maribacter dokdonensis DSW-8]